MIFGQPIPFAEALRRTAARAVMPTNLGTAELRQLGQGVLEKSLFSARTTMEPYLEEVKREVMGLLDGKTDIATTRLKLKETLKALGYEPDPEKRGTIEDLSSDRRLELVIETNTEMAQGFGYDRQGQDEAILDEWPALELFRAESRNQERDWQGRWMIAGQSTGTRIGDGWTVTGDGRLVALKNHAIWDQLGAPELFDDGLGNPYPPFAFGSGMDVRDVSRDEAMEMGLIDRDTRVAPRVNSFFEAVNN
jgi:hypothetical protein